jgi:hypothetical protein
MGVKSGWAERRASSSFTALPAASTDASGRSTTAWREKEAVDLGRRAERCGVAAYARLCNRSEQIIRHRRGSPWTRGGRDGMTGLKNSATSTNADGLSAAAATSTTSTWSS